MNIKEMKKKIEFNDEKIKQLELFKTKPMRNIKLSSGVTVLGITVAYITFPYFLPASIALGASFVGLGGMIKNGVDFKEAEDEIYQSNREIVILSKKIREKESNQIISEAVSTNDFSKINDKVIEEASREELEDALLALGAKANKATGEKPKTLGQLKK